MANLIITVIAIALVAIASLMGAYYGGSAYITNQANANAASVINEGAQIAASWNAYLGDNANAEPSSTSSLLNSNDVAVGGYLQQIPIVPAGLGGVAPYPVFIASATATVGGISKTHYFAYFDVGRPASAAVAGASDKNAVACLRIQKSATGQQPTTISSAGQGAIFVLGNSTFGCAILTGTVASGLGGATVPNGDLTTGDYVAEYLLQ